MDIVASEELSFSRASLCEWFNETKTVSLPSAAAFEKAEAQGVPSKGGVRHARFS
jgi:hypothetical protein